MVERDTLLDLGLQLLRWLLLLLPWVVHELNYLVSGRCQLIRIDCVVYVRYVLGTCLGASLLVRLLIHLKLLWLLLRLLLLLLLVRGLLLVLVELLSHNLRGARRWGLGRRGLWNSHKIVL
jgi:hypothetical protein